MDQHQREHLDKLQEILRDFVRAQDVVAHRLEDVEKSVSRLEVEQRRTSDRLDRLGAPGFDARRVASELRTLIGDPDEEPSVVRAPAKGPSVVDGLVGFLRSPAGWTVLGLVVLAALSVLAALLGIPIDYGGADASIPAP